MWVEGGGSTRHGRDALVKMWAEDFPTFDYDFVPIDEVKVISNDVIVVIGSWSGTWHGPKGPVKMKGRWENTDIRVGDTWKMAVGMANVTPE